MNFTVIISIFSLVISICTFIKQVLEERHYNKKARKVIENSIWLAQYDVLILICKVINEVRDINNYRFQVKSLQRNLETLRSINVSKLPEQASMNYQVYINDLENVIYRISDGLNHLESISFDENIFDNMFNSYSELFMILAQKKSCLIKGKSLFEEYRDNFNKIYSENSREILEGYQIMREEELKRKVKYQRSKK